MRGLFSNAAEVTEASAGEQQRSWDNDPIFWHLEVEALGGFPSDWVEGLSIPTKGTAPGHGMGWAVSTSVLLMNRGNGVGLACGEGQGLDGRKQKGGN